MYMHTCSLNAERAAGLGNARQSVQHKLKSIDQTDVNFRKSDYSEMWCIYTNLLKKKKNQLLSKIKLLINLWNVPHDELVQHFVHASVMPQHTVPVTLWLSSNSTTYLFDTRINAPLQFVCSCFTDLLALTITSLLGCTVFYFVWVLLSLHDTCRRVNEVQSQFVLCWTLCDLIPSSLSFWCCCHFGCAFVSKSLLGSTLAKC